MSEERSKERRKKKGARRQGIPGTLAPGAETAAPRVVEQGVWLPAGGPRTLEIVRSRAGDFGPCVAERPTADGAQQLRLPLGSWMLGLRPASAGVPVPAAARRSGRA